MLFDLDLLLYVETLRRFVQLEPLQVKYFEYLLKGKNTVAVPPTGFANRCQGGQKYFVKYTSSTVRDIYTFAVFCSVTQLFCRFTRVYEGHFMLYPKE